MRGSMLYFHRQHKRYIRQGILVEQHATRLLSCAAQDVSSSAFLCRDHCLLPIEVRISLELCQHFLILGRRIIATIHLEEVGGGVDIGFGVFVALGNYPTIRVNAFEDDAYRWHSSSSFILLWRACQSLIPLLLHRQFPPHHTILSSTLTPASLGGGFPISPPMWRTRRSPIP